MNKKFLMLALVLAMFISSPLIMSAQTTTVTPLSAAKVQLLNRLRQDLAVLRAKVEMLKLQSMTVKLEVRLTKKMMKGMYDQEVKTLQEILATDSEIYPESYVTGYFGVLTEKALKKLQKKAGLAETGEVDDRTLWKINVLLTEGAGRSGKIPPGLLRAPGILKKLGLATTTSPGQDRTAPVVSNVAATATTATTTAIVWQTDEPTTGEVNYATSTPVASADRLMIGLDFSLSTSHRVFLGNLAASTTYYYYLRATDRAGNSATTTDASFMTLSQ